MNVPQTVLTGMRQTNALFEAEVVGKRNINALNRVYTTKARVLPPGAPMVEGRDQIESFWQQAISSLGLKAAKLSIVDAEVVGDRVFEIGQAQLTLANGQTVAVKYVVEWKQEDGAWKWDVDIWNLNQ